MLSPLALHKVLNCINRNIVECKLSSCDLPSHWISVLIETLWNVNGCLHPGHPHRCSRINRNIVECKWQCIDCCGRCRGVLIETLWNVNGSGIHGRPRSAYVLIETLWNVNVVCVCIIRIHSEY